jgi:hypothetical protein
VRGGPPLKPCYGVWPSLSRRLTRAPRTSQPAEYFLFDVDSLDQNGAVNKAGKLLGKLKATDNAPKQDALQVCPLARGRPPLCSAAARRRPPPPAA